MSLQKVPETFVVVLKAMKDAGKAMPVKTIEAIVPNRYPTASVVSHLRSRNYLRSKRVKDEPNVVYELTKYGNTLLAELDQYEITPYQPKPRTKTKGAKKDARNVEVHQAPLNVSATADHLMDNISALIRENAMYREAILKTCQQLASYVGMSLVPSASVNENEEGK